VPESVAVNIRRRNYTIAAGVVIETPAAEVSSLPTEGLEEATACTLKTKSCTMSITGWVKKIQRVTSTNEITPGKHAFTVEFVKTGDDKTMSAVGTLTSSLI